MIVTQQHAPFIPGLAQPVSLASPTIDDQCSLCSSSEGIGARVERIVKDLHDAMIGWCFPDEFADVDIAQDDGHLDIRRPQPQKDLATTPQLPEFGKDEPDRLSHMFVRINLDFARLTPAETRRQHEAELPASRLRITRGDTALTHQAKLLFRHRALQPKQQTIIDESRIVGAIRVDPHVPASAQRSIR